MVLDAESVLSYLLIEAKSYPVEELKRVPTPVATLFQLEQSREVEDLRQGVAKLIKELPGPEQYYLREAFAAMIRESLLKTVAPGMPLPELNNLTEYPSMLKERVIEWRNSWIEEGLQKGRQEGRQEGLLEGEGKVLARLLTMKFGPLSAKVRARLGGATSDELLRWAERVLTAETVDQVFQS